MPYDEYVFNYIDSFEAMDPIYVTVLANAISKKFGVTEKEAVEIARSSLDRILKSGDRSTFRRYDDETYYFTKTTPLGETGINEGKLVSDRYLLPCDGYEGGHMTLLRLGVTTQISRERVIVSNNVTKTQYDEKLDLVITPPRTTITKDNKLYLQLLDAISLMGTALIDVDAPYAILAKYIGEQELCYKKLLMLADELYDQDTVNRIKKTEAAATLQKGGILIDTSHGY